MPIRTAILGYGRTGSGLHAPPLLRNTAFKLAAVCDIDPAARQRAGATCACPVYADYREMLGRERLDLVCVLTRTDQHCAMTCDCLEAGVDVLVTKPWAAHAGEADRMIACAARTGRRLLPWLPARWGCDLRRLRALIDAGAVGKPFLVRRTVASFGTRCDWQTEHRHAGGYLLNWGPHIVDTPLVLLGRPVASVYGRLRQVINPGDVEDLFFAVLTLDDGTLVQAEYTLSPEPLPAWIVQGDRGTITVTGNTVRIHRAVPATPADPTQFATMQTDAATVTEETLTGQTYGDEHEVYADLAAHLRGEHPYPVTPADALQLSRVLDAIRTSSVEDRLVKL